MVDNGSLQQRPIWGLDGEGPRPKGRHCIRPFNDTFAEKATPSQSRKRNCPCEIGGTFVLSQSDYVICGLPNDDLIVMSADARYLSPEGMGTKSEGQAHYACNMIIAFDPKT